MTEVKSKIQPLGDRVLVKPLSAEEKTTKGGIIIPKTAQEEKPDQGEVVAVGEGKRDEKGDLTPLGVKVGDKVIFSKYTPDEIKIDDEEYYILREENILAIVKS